MPFNTDVVVGPAVMLLLCTPSVGLAQRTLELRGPASAIVLEQHSTAALPDSFSAPRAVAFDGTNLVLSRRGVRYFWVTGAAGTGERPGCTTEDVMWVGSLPNAFVFSRMSELFHCDPWSGRTRPLGRAPFIPARMGAAQGDRITYTTMVPGESFVVVAVDAQSGGQVGQFELQVDDSLLVFRGPNDTPLPFVSTAPLGAGDILIANPQTLAVARFVAGGQRIWLYAPSDWEPTRYSPVEREEYLARMSSRADHQDFGNQMLDRGKPYFLPENFDVDDERVWIAVTEGNPERHRLLAVDLASGVATSAEYDHPISALAAENGRLAIVRERDGRSELVIYDVGPP